MRVSCENFATFPIFTVDGDMEKKIRYIVCFFLGARLACVDNIDNNSTISNRNVSGSLNIGITKNVDVEINDAMNVQNYFQWLPVVMIIQTHALREG